MAADEGGAHPVQWYRVHVPPPTRRPTSGSRHRRACAALVASFAAGVRELALELIALFVLARSSPIRCDAGRALLAFADARRIVVGDAGGRVYIHSFEGLALSWCDDRSGSPWGATSLLG